MPGQPGMIRQIGFEENEALIPNDNQLFRGFDFLRDYFAFPRRFLGFDLSASARSRRRLEAKTVDIVRGLRRGEAPARRGGPQGVLRPLRRARRQSVRKDAGPHSGQVQPVRVPRHPRPQPPARFRDEPGDSGCSPIFPARRRKFRSSRSTRRRPRAARPGCPTRFAACRAGARSRKRNTGPCPTTPGPTSSCRSANGPIPTNFCASRNSASKPCAPTGISPKHLPVGESGADFRFLDDVELDVRCIAGPTPAARALPDCARGQRERTHRRGEVAWRLINMLSLNHLGLVDRAGRAARRRCARRSILFADLADSATDRKIRGVRSLSARPIVRRLRQAQGRGGRSGARDHGGPGGEGLRGLGRVSARRGPRPVLRRICGDQPLHPNSRQNAGARRNHALAAAHRPQGRFMTFRAELAAEPWRFDLLAVLRRLERENPNKPRIGDSRKLADEFVTIGQNPYFEFPDFEHRGREHRLDRPRPSQGEVPRHVRPAGRSAADDDRGGLRLASRERRRVRAFRRHLPAPIPGAVFPRLVRRSAGRPRTIGRTKTGFGSISAQ